MLRYHLLYIAVSVSIALVQTAEAAGRGAQLAREMRDTGKPALIIAGNEGCIYCRQMAEELATDRSIQSLARQFLILKVNTESADWPQLRATFSFEESIPDDRMSIASARSTRRTDLRETLMSSVVLRAAMPMGSA